MGKHLVQLNNSLEKQMKYIHIRTYKLNRKIRIKE